MLISVLERKASFRSGRERCVNNLLISTDPRHLPHRTHPPLFTYTDFTPINSPSKIPELWTSAKSQNLQVFISSLNSNEFRATWLPERWLGLSGDHSSGHGCPRKQRRGALLRSCWPHGRFPGGGTHPLRAPTPVHEPRVCLRPLDVCPWRAVPSAVSLFTGRRSWCVSTWPPPYC